MLLLLWGCSVCPPLHQDECFCLHLCKYRTVLACIRELKSASLRVEAVMALVYLQVQTCIFIRGSLLCADYNFYSSSGHHWPFSPGCRQNRENTQTILIVTPRLPVLFHTQITMHKIQTQAAFICPAFCTYCTFKQSHQCILIREALQAGSRERKSSKSCVWVCVCKSVSVWKAWKRKASHWQCPYFLLTKLYRSEPRPNTVTSHW